MTFAVGGAGRRGRARLRVGAGAALGLAAVVAGPTLGGVGLVDQRVAGVTVGLGLLGVALALATWARHGHPAEAQEEDRHSQPALPCLGCRPPARGRRWFLTAAGAAAAAVGGAAVLSQHPRTIRRLRNTAWRPGSALVTADGRVLTVDDLDAGSLVAAWPQGAVGAGDSQVVLLRLEPALVADDTDDADDADPALAGFVAYSRLCTHMGCPLGLFQQDPRALVCPCHQAAFDVLDGGRPLHGPAVRALPRLPLVVDDDGVLRAERDFTEPVGPGWWEAGR